MFHKFYRLCTKKMQKSVKILIGLSCFCFLLCGCTRKAAKPVSLELELEPLSGEMTEESKAGSIQEEQEAQFLYIHICGAVKQPGVYELPEGSRVFEALEAAGGFTEDAGQDCVNQAQFLKDGDQIRIPTTEEADAFLSSQQQKEEGLVNLNTAGREQLCTLPGIGEAKAEAILAYREQNGGFKSIEEIMQIEGIKEGLYNKIKEKIYVP